MHTAYTHDYCMTRTSSTQTRCARQRCMKWLTTLGFIVVQITRANSEL